MADTPRINAKKLAFDSRSQAELRMKQADVSQKQAEALRMRSEARRQLADGQQAASMQRIGRMKVELAKNTANRPAPPAG